MSNVLFVSTNSAHTAMAKKVESVVGNKISLLELHSSKFTASPTSFWNSIINALHFLIFGVLFYFASIYFIVFNTNSKIKYEFLTKIKIYFQKFQGLKIFNKSIIPDWTFSIESYFSYYGKPKLILIADDGILSNSAIIQSQLASSDIPIALIQTYSGVREEYEKCFNTRKRKLLRLPLLPIYACVNSLAGKSLTGIKRNILENYTFPFFPWLRSTLLGFPTNDPYSGYLGYCSIYLMDHDEDLRECKQQVKFFNTQLISIENPIVGMVKSNRNKFGEKTLLFLAPKINQKNEDLKFELQHLILRLSSWSKINGHQFIIVEHPSAQGHLPKGPYTMVNSFEKALIEFNVQLVALCNSSSYRIIEKLNIPIINYDLQKAKYEKTFGNRLIYNHVYVSSLENLETSLSAQLTKQSLHQIHLNNYYEKIDDILRRYF
jgi:hypothetical protein